MSKITDITPQKRNPNLYSIFIDGAFRLSLSSLSISNANLHIGQEVTQAQIEELTGAYQFNKAYSRSLDYLGRRSRSEAEIVEYLTKKDFDYEVINKVVDKLADIKLLDDVAFASAWVRDRNMIKPRSTRQLDVELMKKGIDKHVREQVLAHQGEIELANAVTLARKKIKNPTDFDKQKLIAYLSRMGFSYTIIKKAVDLAACEDQT